MTAVGARGALVWALVALGGGCDDPADDPPGAVDAALHDSGTDDSATDDSGTDDSATDDGPPGADWLRDLPGLWSGPARATPLGDFPVMNMDLRAAGGRTLFSRFDLGPEDGLRFAFAVERVDGIPTVVFRNGGYFLGQLRDTRAVWVEGGQGADEALRFCHPDRGCEYLDARWRRPTPETVELTVDVRGMRHLEWRARRVEARPLPADFAFEPGPFDGPLPTLPSLEVRVTWPDPLPAATPVWLLVSTTACGLSGRCTPARIMSAEAPAGATVATLRIDQIHPGAVIVNGVLDRDGDFRQRRFPSTGDGLTGLDRAVDVAPEGLTAIEAAVVIRVP